MTVARKELVDPTVTRWCHCITRYVRRAFLLGEGSGDHKQWIENRMEELAQVFAVAVGGFGVLESHLHVLVRVDPNLAAGWSDADVVRRWGRLFPPHDAARQALPISEVWVQHRLQETAWVGRGRERLHSLSWFMKCLKELLSFSPKARAGCTLGVLVSLHSPRNGAAQGSSRLHIAYPLSFPFCQS